MRVLPPGPRGQLGRDVRRAHEEAGGPFELSSLARGALDVAAPAPPRACNRARKAP